MRHPDVPESLEGWWMLHRMFAFDRRAWSARAGDVRSRIAQEARETLRAFKEREDTDVALARIVGHKGDFMLTHYAKRFEDLGVAQTALDQLALSEYLHPRSSFVSILELGLYEATANIHAALRDRTLKRFSPEWNDAFDALLAQQAEMPRNAARLWARIPTRPYVCFYPMDKKRGEDINWYALPYAERARLMLDHGKIGRSYHGLVTQVISGAIGLDDWEWGVDLYADDPLVFKKLIYEMRFDEASAKYASFGQFYSGVQFTIDELEDYLDGSEAAAIHPLLPA